MIYVNPKDVLIKFECYLDTYDHDMISKEIAIEELKDALDDAEYEEIED